MYKYSILHSLCYWKFETVFYVPTWGRASARAAPQGGPRRGSGAEERAQSSRWMAVSRVRARSWAKSSPGTFPHLALGAKAAA